MNRMIAVHRAEVTEAGALATTLARAFQPDPVSSWVFPDPDDRSARHPHFFRIFADVALADGQAYTTPNYDAVALWVDVDPDNPKGSKHLGDLFEEACGPNYQRFRQLDQAMYAHHPSQALHAYLAFVGVVPERQGPRGGATLLR